MWKQCASIVFLFVYTWHFYVRPWRQTSAVYLDNLELRLDKMQIRLTMPRTGMARLHVDLAVDGDGLNVDRLHGCSKDDTEDGTVHCVEYERIVRLEIMHRKKAKCYTVRWTALSSDFVPHDCIHLEEGRARWYGGWAAGSSGQQRWPMNAMQAEQGAYVPGSIHHGSVIERYWLSSRGIGLYVHHDVPLHVGWNDDGDQQLCIKADYSDSPYPNPDGDLPVLSYTMCEDFDMMRAHRLMAQTLFQRPAMLDDDVILRTPTWYPGFNATMTAADVIQYGKDVRRYGFQTGVMDLDRATQRDGNFELTSSGHVIETLHKLGFKVAASVSPLISINSSSFHEGLRNGFWVRGADSQMPVLTKWRRDAGAILDVTNPDAAQWFVDQLQQWKERSGLDRWRFRGGEGSWIPSWAASERDLDNPSDFTRKYVGLAAQAQNGAEVHVGYRSQKHAVMVTVHRSRRYKTLTIIINDNFRKNIYSK